MRPREAWCSLDRRARRGALSVLLSVAALTVGAPLSAQGEPAGHPGTDEARANAPGMFEPPPDTEDEDAALPGGTIAIELRDADNHALPHTDITLGVIHQSVAKGESREHKSAVTDEMGIARIDHLETGSGIAYRVTVPKEGATFAALPFQLSATKGMRVGLHVYPVTHDLAKALIVMQAILYAELKDDRLQLQEAVTVFNFGKVTWVPDDVIIKLPPEFTALNGQQQMSDTGVDLDKQGAKLRGTFSPGRHDIEFRWQLPYAGETELTFDVGLPPHVAVMRVMALASQEMKLAVQDFPDPERKTDAQGQRLLVTEKQLRRDDAALTTLHLSLRDLPAPGPGRYVASALAGLGVLLGVGFAFTGGRRTDAQRKSSTKAARARLLAELEDLERAHRSGDVGPKTYERARRELIDAIARTLASTEPASRSPS